MERKEKEKKKIIKLAKILRPHPNSRFLPGQVSIEEDNKDLVTYIEHRLNVEHAHPKIDNKPPKFPLEIYYNKKKLKEIAARVKALDQKNIELLQNMNVVLRSKTKVDCWNKLIPPYEDKMKERIEKNKIVVSNNNETMLKIKKVASNYSRAKLLEDWKKNKTILEKMSKLAHRYE